MRCTGASGRSELGRLRRPAGVGVARAPVVPPPRRHRRGAPRVRPGAGAEARVVPAPRRAACRGDPRGRGGGRPTPRRRPRPFTTREDAGMSDAADLVVVGARVHGTPGAQAVAISGTRISAIGTATEIRAVADARTEVLELPGATLLAGMNDA